MAIQNYEKGLELLRNLENQEDLPILLNNLSVVYQKSGYLDRAESALEQCVDLLDAAGLSESPQSVRVLMNLLEVYAATARIEKAIHCGELATKISHQIGDIWLEVSAWNNLGAFYWSQRDYSNALRCYSQCLELSWQIPARDSQSLALNNLAAVYEEMGDLQAAQNFYEQSQSISAEINDIYGIARVHNNLGVLFEKQSNYSQSLWHYQQAQRRLHQISDYYRETIAIINIASIYARLSQEDMAWEWRKQGIHLATQYGYGELLVSLEILAGDLAFQFINTYQDACDSYARACQHALGCDTQTLHRFVEIAEKRLDWLGNEKGTSLCKVLLETCGERLQSSAPGFYQRIIDVDYK